MSVLVEAFSVIIRGDSIIKTFGKRGVFGFNKKNAWDHFKEVCGSEATLCADGDLVRYGFMRSEDALDFINFFCPFSLSSKGIHISSMIEDFLGIFDIFYIFRPKF